jgi:hypothetical protein
MVNTLLLGLLNTLIFGLIISQLFSFPMYISSMGELIAPYHHSRRTSIIVAASQRP